MMSEKNGRTARAVFPLVCFFFNVLIYCIRKSFKQMGTCKKQMSLFHKRGASEYRSASAQAEEMCPSIKCSGCLARLSHVTSTVTP